jgi:hypothetical protein
LSRSTVACMTSALVFSRTPGGQLGNRSTVASLSPDCCAISRTCSGAASILLSRRDQPSGGFHSQFSPKT